MLGQCSPRRLSGIDQTTGTAGFEIATSNKLEVIDFDSGIIKNVVSEIQTERVRTSHRDSDKFSNIRSEDSIDASDASSLLQMHFNLSNKCVRAAQSLQSGIFGSRDPPAD
jgi:hypothetical protein